MLLHWVKGSHGWAPGEDAQIDYLQIKAGWNSGASKIGIIESCSSTGSIEATGPESLFASRPAFRMSLAIEATDLSVVRASGKKTRASLAMAL